MPITLGPWEAVQPYLGDSWVTTAQFLNRVPRMAAAGLASISTPGSFNLGAFRLLLACVRPLAHVDPILEVSALVPGKSR